MQITLFGGEPLLPKTKPTVQHLLAKAPDKFYHIITNGYYLEEFFDLLSQAKILNIMVTLDGGEEAHNSRRYLANGKPTYSKIVAGVEKYLSHGIPIRIRMNLDHSNFDEGLKLKAELLEKFAEYQSYFSIETDAMFGSAEEEKMDIITKLYAQDTNQTTAERIRRNKTIGCSNSILDTVAAGLPLKPKYCFCYAHENVMIFDPYGDIYPCLAGVDKPGAEIGHYHPKEVMFG